MFILLYHILHICVYFFSIAPYIPGVKGRWGGIGKDNRDFVETVLNLAKKKDKTYRTLEWKRIGDKRNSYNRRFTNWRKKGIWEDVLSILIRYKKYAWLSSPHIYGVFLTNYDLIADFNEVYVIFEHNPSVVDQEDPIMWIFGKIYPHFMKNRERRERYLMKNAYKVKERGAYKKDYEEDSYEFFKFLP